MPCYSMYICILYLGMLFVNSFFNFFIIFNKNFQEETHTFINPEKQLEFKKIEKEHNELEL